MVFDSLPAHQQAVLVRAFDAVEKVDSVTAGGAAEEGDRFIQSGLEFLMHSRFDGDTRDLGDHAFFPERL